MPLHVELDTHYLDSTTPQDPWHLDCLLYSFLVTQPRSQASKLRFHSSQTHSCINLIMGFTAPCLKFRPRQCSRFVSCFYYVLERDRFKLSCNRKPASPRPISIIFPEGAFFPVLFCSGASLSISTISNTSRTPWIILISPVNVNTRPLSRWTENLGEPSSGALCGSNSVDSQRRERSHDSSSASWDTETGSSASAIVDIVFVMSI